MIVYIVAHAKLIINVFMCPLGVIWSHLGPNFYEKIEDGLLKHCKENIFKLHLQINLK